MSNTEQALRPSEPVLTPEEIDLITLRVAIEGEARKRKMPRWNPASPWRPLSDVFIAALQANTAIRIADIEVILGGRRVWMVGIRNDKPTELPDRIEGVL